MIPLLYQLSYTATRIRLVDRRDGVNSASALDP